MVKLGHSIQHFAEKILGRIYSPDEIRKFIITRFTELKGEIQKGPQPFEGEVIWDLLRVQDFLFKAKWITSQEKAIQPILPIPKTSKEKLESWKRAAWDGKAIQQGIIRAGAGYYLDQIDEREGKFNDQFMRNNLELLLRHVEVKRENCLKEFEPESNDEYRWLERHNVAILFARHAQRSRDLRFLNAAFKLNDWHFPHYQKNVSHQRLARFLLALVEQEASARELLE